MNSRKLASVIVRTYNEEKYLEQLIKAVKSQKCLNVDVEVVIVDSGSTDSYTGNSRAIQLSYYAYRKE